MKDKKELEQKIREEFETHWETVHKPLSGDKKGYKKGFSNGFIVGRMKSMEETEKLKSEVKHGCINCHLNECHSVDEAKRLEALECLRAIDHCINIGIKDIQYNGNPMIFLVETINTFLENLGEK